MNITSSNCEQILEKYLCDIPWFWRNQVAKAICSSVAGEGGIPCSAIRACETLTSLSAFSRSNTQISVTFKDEKGVSYTRTFDYKAFLDKMMDGVNPKCLMSQDAWNNLEYHQRIEAILDYKCHHCCPTTTTTSTTTTSSSTTTTTTGAPPACLAYHYENTSEFQGALSWVGCSGTQYDARPKGYSAGQFCALEGTVSGSQDVIITLVGDCTGGTTTTTTTLATTTTTTTSSTTTTTTTAPTTTTTSTSSTTTSTTLPEEVCLNVTGIEVVIYPPTTTTTTTTGGSTTTTTTGVPVMAYWGFKDDDTVLSEMDIEASSYHGAFPHNATIVANYFDNGVPKFLWMAYKTTESTKITWWGDSLNNGNIGGAEDLFGPAAVSGSYNFLITQYLTHNTSTDIEFRDY